MRTAMCLCALFLAVPSAAQYAETPESLFVADGAYSAAQIGRRLFIAGSFRRVAAPSGTAVVVDQTGSLVPDAFPRVTGGSVHQIVSDAMGGWLLVGDFTSVGGHQIARFARVAADRSVDTKYRVTADGLVRFVAVAHGRIYLAGEFTTVNGVPRRGLAALDTTTAQLTGWGAAFAATGQVLALSASSIGVYVSTTGRLTGIDAGSGAILFERDAVVTAIAATSTRVYVGGYGYRRPVWAVDPFSGQDTDWALGFQFRPIEGTYFEYTNVTALLLDAGRLYLGGNFHTSDDRHHYLAAAEASSGTATSWRPELTMAPGESLVRIGPALVATGSLFLGQGPGVGAYDVASGAVLPFRPTTFGHVRTVAAAPEGAVIGGDFDGIDGVSREGLASINLDTGQIEPWSSTLPPFTGLEEIVSDGTWLIARTRDSRYLKIDPVSGAIVAEHRVSTGDVILVRMSLAGGDLVTVVSERYQSPKLGLITIADWSYRQLPVTFDGISQYVTGLDVDGDAIYLMGAFDAVNGQSRPFLAAVRKATGEVLPWRPSPDADARAIRVGNGRVWVGGDFHRIGGKPRRGLAELDPTTGAARSWNPDVPVGLFRGLRLDVSNILLGSGDVLYVTIPGLPGAVVSGQETAPMVAFSTVTGRRLPWRPAAASALALPDCLAVWNGCMPPGISAPTDLRVSRTGDQVSLQWTLPVAAPVRTGVRLEVGSAEGLADLYQVDLPASQTSFTAPAPPGSYFARVRSLAGARVSMSTADVSFAVGSPDALGAPLNLTGVTEGTRLTLEWQAPSSGVPAAYVFEAGSARGRANLASISLPGNATTYTVDAPIGFYFGRLRAVNAAGASAPSNEVLLDVGTTQQIYCGDGPPQAPGGLMASVTGRTVSLTWQPSPDGSRATAQRILAGSAPGLADLATLDTTAGATAFSATAPPGTYHVRVIALNACGSSPASNDVLVVVP